MSVVSKLLSPGAWHIVSYGTLLGVQFFQSFVGGVVAFKTLSRPSFSQLQQKIFPIYFSMQTALPLALLLTHPGRSSVTQLLSPSSPYFKNTTLPIMIIFLNSLGNLALVGPATTKIMRERKAQETKEGKKYYDEGPKSKEMESLNHRFSVMHGVSSLMNLAAYLATVGYGFVLGERLVF